MHPQDQGQVQPLDQAPHAQDHEADRQYQRCGTMWGEGAHFHQRKDREEADPAAFREDNRQVGQAAEYPEAAIHQAQRQGISSDHINGTEGGRREAP